MVVQRKEVSDSLLVADYIIPQALNNSRFNRQVVSRFAEKLQIKNGTEV